MISTTQVEALEVVKNGDYWFLLKAQSNGFADMPDLECERVIWKKKKKEFPFI